MNIKYYDITWSSLWKIFAMVILATTLFVMREALLIAFVSVVLSSSIYGIVKFFEKKGIPRIISTLTIFILAIAIIILTLYAILPIALIQLQYLLNNISGSNASFSEMLGISKAINNLKGSIGWLLGMFFKNNGEFFGFVKQFFGNMFFVIISLVLTFYLTISKDGVERFLKSILPKSQEKYSIDLYHRTRKKLERWLGGQLTLSFFVGLLTFIGLLILGIKYAFVLSILAAILELVPYVGPIVVGTIAFVVALPQSLMLAILAVVIFFIIQQIENHLLVPIIMGKAIGVDPVIVVIAILAGSSIAGLIGALIAVPAVIIIEELLDDWSVVKKSK